MFNVEAYIQLEFDCNEYESKLAAAIIAMSGFSVDPRLRKDNSIGLKGSDGCIAELTKDVMGRTFFSSQEKNDEVEKHTVIYLHDITGNSMHSTITTKSDRKEVFGSVMRGNVQVYNTESLEMIEKLLASGKSMDEVSKIVSPDDVIEFSSLDSGDAVTKYFNFVKQFDQIVGEQEKSLAEPKQL